MAIQTITTLKSYFQTNDIPTEAQFIDVFDTMFALVSVGTIANGVWQGTKIAEGYGGTNQSTYATGDILYASGVNTLAKRTAGSTGDILTIAGGVPTWAAPAGASGSISALTAAQGGNTINNLNFAQEWDWSTLTTQTAFKLNANGNTLTTGNLLSLVSASTAYTSGYLLNIGLTGANAASATTTVGANFSNTRTGTTSVNVAARFQASGGATNNYQTIWEYSSVYKVGCEITSTGLWTISSIGSSNTEFALTGKVTFGTSMLTLAIFSGVPSGTAPYFRGNGSYLVCDTRGDYLYLQYDSKGSTVVGGKLGVGGIIPLATLHSQSTTEQLRLGYDANYYFKTTVASTAITTFDLTATSGVPYFALAKDIRMSASRLQEAKGINVTAGNNLTLGLDGNVFVITGNTTINAIITANWQAGASIVLIFSGTPTVKHNTAGGAGTATMLLSTSVDMTAAANTVLGLCYDGTNWQETFRKFA